MKNILLLLLFALLPIYGISAKESIAVWVIGDSDIPEAYKKVIATSVTQAINNDGHFVAVERVDDFLAALSSEVSYQQSGAVGQDKLVELGRQNGADYVFAISLSKVFDEIYASSRIINVEKNVVEAAHGESRNVVSMDALKKLSANIASGTLAKMPYNIEKQEKERQRRLEAQRQQEQKEADRQRNLSIVRRYKPCRITSGRQLFIAFTNYRLASMDDAKEWIWARKALDLPIPFPIIVDVAAKEENSKHYGSIYCELIKGLPSRFWDIDYYRNQNWKKKDNLEGAIVGTVLISNF